MKLIASCLTILLVVAVVPAVGASSLDIDQDGFVTILLPIAMASHHVLPGGYGSQWAEELWLYNASSTWSYPLQYAAAGPTPLSRLDPGELARHWSFASNNLYGAILLIPAPAAEDFHISARLVELSRNAQPTGVEIPVVPEGSSLNRETWILGVPAGEGIRSTLRVFSLQPGKPTTLAATFHDAEGKVLTGTTLAPGLDPAAPRPNESPQTAGMDAVFDLTATIPALAGADYFSIQLSPVGDPGQFWAFVTVTHNETQHVLFLTPKP